MENESSRSIAPQEQVQGNPPKEYAVEATAVILGGDPHLSFTLGFSESPTPPNSTYPIHNFEIVASVDLHEPGTLVEIGSTTVDLVAGSTLDYEIPFTNPGFPNGRASFTVQLVASGTNNDNEPIEITNWTDNTFSTSVTPS